MKYRGERLRRAQRASVCCALAVLACSSAQEPLAPPDPTPPPPLPTGALAEPYAATPIGWAAVNDLGYDGTTGGGDAEPETVTTTAELQAALSFTRAAPRVILLSGTLGDGLRFNVSPHTTLLGTGDAPTLQGALDIKDVANVIVRNLNIRGANPDGIGIRRSHHVWIDHVDIADSVDGNLDISDESDYLTVSWSKFWYQSSAQEHRFSNLVGSDDAAVADQGKLRVTYHHNWWADNVAERMPRVRFGRVHVFNNLYSAKGNSYCVEAGAYSDILTENNAFIGVNNPIELKHSNAFSVVYSRGNLYAGSTGHTADMGDGVFTPPYEYGLHPAANLDALIRAQSGTCSAPRVFTALPVPTCSEL